MRASTRTRLLGPQVEGRDDTGVAVDLRVLDLEAVARLTSRVPPLEEVDPRQRARIHSSKRPIDSSNSEELSETTKTLMNFSPQIRLKEDRQRETLVSLATLSARYSYCNNSSQPTHEISSVEEDLLGDREASSTREVL